MKIMDHRLSKKEALIREISLESIINLINTQPYLRTKQDKKKLHLYFCYHAQYFSKLQQENQLDKVSKLISYLKIENFKKNAHIMNFGEEGDKFYTLLSGKIGIYKPFPKETESTFKEYVEYLVYVRDVEKNIKKFNRVQDYNSKIDKYRLIMINYDPSKITTIQKKMKIFIEEERKLIELGDGCSFGEMALIKNEPRNATIIALEDCITVTVDRTDYKKIMKELEEQRINIEIAKFKNNFPIFLNWNNGGCSKLKSGLINEIYEKDDYIFKQNDIAKYIYLLVEGEIEISCDVNFGSYEKFIEYIYDNSNTLFNEFDNSFAWKEDNLHKLIEEANQKNSLPFNVHLPRIEKFISLHSHFINMKDNNNKDDPLENIDQLEKENEYIHKIIHRINIENLKAPQFFGFLEILELKRRFCNVKCISNTVKIQKFPLIEYLTILPRDQKNHFHLEKTLYAKKKYLIEQLRNGVMAKLDFHGNLLRNKKFLGNYYPDRNRDKVIIIKPRILIKSISTFSMEKQNKNKNRSMKNILYFNNGENKNNIKNSKDSLIVNSKSNLIIGFKKTLFNRKQQRNKSQNGILCKNNKKIQNYSEDTISTGKYSINSKLIPKILLKKNIRDYNALSSSRSNIRNEVISLPSIGNRVVNNYFPKNIKDKGKDKDRNKSSLEVINREKLIFE